ncbi:hypothetical protein [Acanthopleuribacter pedis]|uniref:Uncharacterized protein n=1 Tax=Acanthopleuribacter pedis TaxID=442870 RepID=A0A8J7Q088_9BACT|nr:hypothetical protein [Acanthopleuribacter pedis]MBO1316860.1 hypothetical protein [Acanthopleuribacter pedis]
MGALKRELEAEMEKSKSLAPSERQRLLDEVDLLERRIKRLRRQTLRAIYVAIFKIICLFTLVLGSFYALFLGLGESSIEGRFLAFYAEVSGYVLVAAVPLLLYSLIGAVRWISFSQYFHEIDDQTKLEMKSLYRLIEVE